jgi:hypothetical protein
MSEDSSNSRAAFSGIWINKPGAKGVTGAEYRCALIFFRWRGDNFTARFNREDDYIYQGAHIGSYLLEGSRIAQQFQVGAGVTTIKGWWKAEKDGSLTVSDPESTEHFIPSTLSEATAHASTPQIVQEFLTEAKERGWEIDHVARVPGVRMEAQRGPR